MPPCSTEHALSRRGSSWCPVSAEGADAAGPATEAAEEEPVWADNPVEDAVKEADQSSSMLLWTQLLCLMASWEKLGHDPGVQPSMSQPPKSGDLSEVMSQLEVRRAEFG